MDKDQQFNASLYKHWVDDSVRFSDLDAVGHVNNNAISQYFENARAFLYQQITPDWPHGKQFFVLARTAIDYHRELNMPASLRVSTGVLRIGKTSLTLANALFRVDEQGEDGIAWCESVSVLIDTKTRRPVEISPELRKLCEGYQI